MAGESLIDVRDLYKEFALGPGLSVPVLKGIDLRIEAGEFVAIMGPSGSGKSTFMSIIGCLDVPTRGEYFFNGQNTARLDADELAHLRNRLIGFVFQGFNLLPRINAVENVELPMIYADVDKTRQRRRATALLTQFGLANDIEKLPSQLSGGQQQRVAIARALANEPRLILADEPTGNLDTRTSIEIMRLFQTLNTEQGITIVLVTHEADIAAYAHRLVHVIDGRIANDTPTTPKRADSEAKHET